LDAPWRWNVTPYFLRDLTIVIPFSGCKGCGALGLCLPFLLFGSPLSVLSSQSNLAIQLFLAKHFPARTYGDAFSEKRLLGRLAAAQRHEMEEAQLAHVSRL
jgi:hypothetical protein